MKNQSIQCFVCGIPLLDGGFTVNETLLLPECDNCKDTEAEKAKVKEMLDSLAEDLICGCV